VNRLFVKKTSNFDNHPEAKGFCGDIWEVKDDLIKYYKENYV